MNLKIKQLGHSLLVLLFAVLLIGLAIRYRENRDLPEEPVTDTPVIVEEDTTSDDFTELTYSNGSATLSFSQNEDGTWLWNDGPNFPLNDSTVLAIVEQLETWSPRETITDAATLETCGFNKPSASLTASTPQRSLTLIFGKAVADGSGYYVRLNEDTTTAYVMDKTLYQLLSTPIYDMYELPTFPQLTESNIRSIVIRGYQSGEVLAITTLSAQSTDGDIPTLRSSGANVSDDPRVRGLLADLQALALGKCVSYRPSDKAVSVCGLEQPAATLTVDFTNAEGLGQILTMSIGNRLDDRSGRYVRIDEDSTIYMMPTELLDPLMNISVKGLE